MPRTLCDVLSLRDRPVGGRAVFSAGRGLGLLLAVALVRLVAPDSTARRRTEDAVAGDMPGHAADGRALEAALGLGARGGHEGRQGEGRTEQNRLHDVDAFRSVEVTKYISTHVLARSSASWRFSMSSSVNKLLSRAFFLVIPLVAPRARVPGRKHTR